METKTKLLGNLVVMTECVLIIVLMVNQPFDGETVIPRTKTRL